MATVYLGLIYNGLQSQLNTNEDSLRTAINGMIANSGNEAPSQAALLEIQYKMQRFAVLSEFTASFEKKLGDAFQAICQKF
jgi:hypothetical protein